MNWNDVKKGNFSEEKKEPSVWAAAKAGTIEPTRGITFEDLDSPSIKAEPVKVDNQFPVGTISYDMETWSADQMFSAPQEFLMLTGYSVDDGDVVITTNHAELVNRILDHEGWIIGHNILNYDNILLDRFFGLSILELAFKERIVDTKLCCFLADPPLSRTKEGEVERIYSLDNQGKIYLGEGKSADAVTGKSMLKELAKEFGGFDKIPVDDPRYVYYLQRDVEITRDLARVIPMNDYSVREHKIGAVAATISIQGFRVDVDLLRERIQQGETKRHKILTSLQGYGLPGPDEAKAPHRTNLGLAAIDQAFKDAGTTLPRTATGRPACGKDILQGVIDGATNQDAIDLAEAVLSLNGIRTIYANIDEYLIGDRVHPSINLRQSSGRWSITKPGLTVLGKRDGKVIERAVFLPDNEDEILISVDLAQVDARCVAGLAQDWDYIQAFSANDIHTEMAVALFGSPDKRELAKACVHAMNYGAQANKLVFMTGIELHVAEEIIANFARKFPRVNEWQWKIREEGETRGVLYNGFGRLMRIEPERSFTQSPALMGQSTARDILMEGIINLYKKGGEQIIRMIRGVIHDELVLSVPIKDVDEIEQLVVDSLSFSWCPIGGEYAVPIEAGLNKRGVNWADCYRKN